MIFAVTAEQTSVYERLGQHIEGASTGTLSENSENVVELVKDQYSVRHFIFFYFSIQYTLRLSLNNLYFYRKYHLQLK